MRHAIEHILRLALKALVFVVGGVAWVRGVNVIVADWGWGSVPPVLAVFVPPVPVFVAPIYEGIVHGSWTSSLLFYTVFIVLSVPFGLLERRKNERALAQM